MHIRRSTVTRKGKRYAYTQLVESFRREDGMPAHRVLHSFGPLSDLEHENLKLTFQASANGKAVVLAGDAPAAALNILDNLGYLPHAVLLDLWKAWGLPELIERLANEDARDVPVSDVLGALALQRCIQPESKLASVEWYERTALPELQGCALGSYNNSRVHRALDALFNIEEPLQEAVAAKVVASQGRPHLLFLDCTDTWFTSEGPPLASKRFGKDQVLRMQVGILLLCDQEGLPLRWATLPGGHHEADSMLKIASAVSRWQWAKDAPLVMDRACGTHVMVAQLQAAGVRFISAVPSSELATYSHRVPVGAFDTVEPDADALRQRALELGFVQVSDERYVLDLDIFPRGEREEGTGDHTFLPTLSRAAAALLLARKIRTEQSCSNDTHEAIAERYGMPSVTVRRLTALLSFDDAAQRAILEGHAARLPMGKLRELAVLPPEAQLPALLAAEEAALGDPYLSPTKLIAEHCGAVDVLRVRGVVTFNPCQFLNERQAAHERQEKLDASIAEINRKLALPGSRRTEGSILAEVGEYLRRRSLLSMFDIGVAKVALDGREVWQVSLARNEAESLRRRGLDGLNLIIAHPDIIGTGADLVAHYFAKDKVEKDFRIIKSSLQLRPVHHRTDPKVQAHVSLCVLALLLERTLEKKLRAAGLPWTAEKALRTLSSCHLNRFATEKPLYSPTVPTREQRVLIEALNLNHLLDPAAISTALTPR